jgi:subtilase family serine protease
MNSNGIVGGRRRRHCAAFLGGVAVLALTCLSVNGWAQAGTYQTTTTAITYEKITDGTSFGVTGGGSSSGGGATLKLGFPMKFYGQSFTEVYTNVYGQVLFGTTSDRGKGYSTGIGDSATPNGWVSPWWITSYSLSIKNASDFVYKITGGAGNHVALIQWDNWGYYYSGGRERSMQVVLREATRTIELRYGSVATTGSSYEYALAGAEDPTGKNEVSALTCNTKGSYSRGCQVADWPANKSVALSWVTQDADLAAAVAIDSITKTVVSGSPSLEIAVTTTVFNLGKLEAKDFVFDLYQSADSTIDPASDTKVSSHLTPVTLAALSEKKFSETLFIPRPSNGEVFLGIDVDPTLKVKEADEGNNRAASDGFVVGTDFAVSRVSGPATAGLQDRVSIAATLSNRGSDAATATFGIYLSEDAVIDPAIDKKAGEVSVTLNGFETKAATLEGVVPMSLPIGGGELYWGVFADPKGQVQETSRANNWAASSRKVALVLPDVKPENKIATSAESYFGEKASVEFDLENDGDADAHDVSAILLLSENAVITLNDPQIARLEHFEVSKKSKTRVTFSGVNIPLTRQDGTAYASGDYFFGIIVDPDRLIPETNEANNASSVIPSVRLRQPAADFVAVRVDGPLAAASSEVVPVSRLIRNQGNRGNVLSGKAYRYSFFLSENQVISPQDVRLPLMQGGQPKDFGTGRLAAGADDRAVDLVRMPASLNEGSYFLGMIVDPDQEIEELREDNNLVASGALVTVGGGALAVSTSGLPDAVDHVAYLHQLVAAGGDGTFSWQLGGASVLPPGLALSSDGVLSGVPSQRGSYEFSVVVKSGQAAAFARFGMRVLGPTGALSVSTLSLPLAIEGQAYGASSRGAAGVSLTAVGGTPPYVWSMTGTLPRGLSLSGSTLAGAAEQGTAGDYALDVFVVDTSGARAEAKLKLSVVMPGTLAIDTRTLPPPVLAGQPYSFAFPVVGGSPPYKATISGGALPEGLVVSAGADRAFVTGTAVRPGPYPFVLTVADGSGRKAARSFVIVVHPAVLSVKTDRLPEATRGQTYDAFLEVDSREKTTFRVRTGGLPPGLAMDDAGTIHGVVDAEASPRAYNFIVEARDRLGAQGLAPLFIYVRPPPDELPATPGTCGCTSTPGSSIPLGAWVLAMVLRGRRKR